MQTIDLTSDLGRKVMAAIHDEMNLDGQAQRTFTVPGIKIEMGKDAFDFIPSPSILVEATISVPVKLNESLESNQIQLVQE